MPNDQENHLSLFISSSYSYYSRWEMCFKTCLSSYYKTDTVLCRLKSKEEGEKLFELRGKMEKHGRKRVKRWNNQREVLFPQKGADVGEWEVPST